MATKDNVAYTQRRRFQLSPGVSYCLLAGAIVIAGAGLLNEERPLGLRVAGAAALVVAIAVTLGLGRATAKRKPMRN